MMVFSGVGFSSISVWMRLGWCFVMLVVSRLLKE